MKILKGVNDNIFNILYILLLFLLPLMYFNNITEPELIPRQLVLSFFLIVIVSIMIFSKTLEGFGFLYLWLPKAIVLLLICYIVSFIFAINKAESYYVISKVGIFFVFYLITTNLLISKRLDVNAIIKGIITLNFIIVTISIYQLAGLIFSDLNLWENIDSIYSTFLNKNSFSSALLLSIPFLICSYRLSNIWKYLSIIGVVLSVLLILLLQTRAVWLAMFVSALIGASYLVLGALKNLNSNKIKNIQSLQTNTISEIRNSQFTNHNSKKFEFVKLNLIIIFLIIFTGIYVVMIKHYKKAKTEQIVSSWKRESFSLVDNLRTVEPRKLLWLKSLKMIKDYPLTGVGGGNWQIVFPEYGLNGFSKGTQNNIMTHKRPHNDYIWVFCETGLIGFLSFILIFFLGLLYIFRSMRSITNTDNKILVGFLGIALISYLVISFFDFPFESILHLGILAIILSIITFELKKNTVISKESILAIKSTKITYIFLILLIPVILFSMIVCSYRYIGLLHTKHIYEAYYEKKWNKLIDEVGLAGNYFYNLDNAGTPIYWYEGVAYSSLYNNEAALKSFQNGLKLNPNNLLVLNNLGSCYELQHEHYPAIEYYTKAINIAPKFEEAVLNLSATYFNMKNYESAFKTIKQLKINATSKNYLVFLYIILQKKIEMMANNHQYNNQKNKLNDLSNDKNRLISIYKESKAKNIDFEEYTLTILNQQ